MAGEEGPLKRSVTAGVCDTTARGIASVAACTAEAEKKQVAAAAFAGFSESVADNCADATAASSPGGGEREEADPEKRMTRLPQEEVDWILAREFHALSDFEALRRSKPGLTPPAGEELDEATELFYDATRWFYAGQERFFKLQDKVRQQYEEKGFVEVDDDYLTTKAHNRAVLLESMEEAFEEVFGDGGFSDTDDDDEFDDKPVSLMRAWLGA